MKKFILLFLLFSVQLFCQLEYVQVDHRVYDFLERMNYNHLIENYNSFERPKSRKEIAGYLVEVNGNKAALSAVDKELLQRFLQ